MNKNALTRDLPALTLMDYGRPIKPFSLKLQTFGFGQTDWADKVWGIWGIFGRFISTHFFGNVNHLFSNNQPLFL